MNTVRQTPAEALGRANQWLAALTARMASPPAPAPAGERLYAGVDLGTAYVVVTVVDAAGQPVDAASAYAEVVRDGLVVDYAGAVAVVRELKAQLERRLGAPLLLAAAAYPPGTGRRDVATHRYVCESAGFEIVAMVDEVAAANRVLGIQDGVVVDVGGGTTGVAVLQDGQVVHLADEPTGGTHLTLVLAGAYRIPFAEAESRKKDPSRQSEILRLVTPVIQKVGTIVRRHMAGFPVEQAYVVGGTACLEGFATVLQSELGLPVHRPDHPLFVTPLGIAMAAAEAGEGRGR